VSRGDVNLLGEGVEKGRRDCGARGLATIWGGKGKKAQSKNTDSLSTNGGDREKFLDGRVFLLITKGGERTRL